MTSACKLLSFLFLSVFFSSVRYSVKPGPTVFADSINLENFIDFQSVQPVVLGSSCGNVR